MFKSGLKSLIYWSSQNTAKALLADHFGHAFFAALQTPVATIPEVHAPICALCVWWYAREVMISLLHAPMACLNPAQDTANNFQIAAGSAAYIVSSRHKVAQSITYTHTHLGILLYDQNCCYLAQKGVLCAVACPTSSSILVSSFAWCTNKSWSRCGTI